MADLADLELASRVERMKAVSRIRDLETRIAAIEATDRRLIDENSNLREGIGALAARHEKALVEGAARLAERDEARAWADTMLQKIEVLEAQIAAKDAALTHIVNECSRFPIKDGLAFRCESIALNALEKQNG